MWTRAGRTSPRAAVGRCCSRARTRRALAWRGYNVESNTSPGRSAPQRTSKAHAQRTTCPTPGCSAIARRAACPLRPEHGVARPLPEVPRPLSRISTPRSTRMSSTFVHNRRRFDTWLRPRQRAPRRARAPRRSSARSIEASSSSPSSPHAAPVLPLPRLSFSATSAWSTRAEASIDAAVRSCPSNTVAKRAAQSRGSSRVTLAFRITRAACPRTPPRPPGAAADPRCAAPDAPGVRFTRARAPEQVGTEGLGARYVDTMRASRRCTPSSAFSVESAMTQRARARSPSGCFRPFERGRVGPHRHTLPPPFDVTRCKWRASAKAAG